MYTMLNNQDASKFDLYLPGKLVASLHYKLTADEMMFVYCESIESLEAERHCRELMRRATEDVKSRRMTIQVACPIALKFLRETYSGTAVPDRPEDAGTPTGEGLPGCQAPPVAGHMVQVEEE